MKTYLLRRGILLMGIAASSPPAIARAEPPIDVTNADVAKPASLSLAELFQRANPAVVKIMVDGESHRHVSQGSGFVSVWRTADSCEVITNHHVIRPGIKATVQFENGSVGDVERVLIEDEASDLALLSVQLAKPIKIHPSWTAEERASMEAASHARSKTPIQAVIDVNAAGTNPPIGTRVIAIGSPRGMSNTLSDGLVSGYRTEGTRIGWVQITNPISPGSSGGVLLDTDGNFVGVTTATLVDAQNVNFAIPASAVRAFLQAKSTPRHLWDGSCINCQEEAVYRSVFDKVFDSYCSSSDELQSERDHSSIYFYAVGQVPIVLGERSQRFVDFCEELAKKEDPLGLIIRGYSKARESRYDSAAVRHGIRLLEKALPNAKEYDYFLHYSIGESEWFLPERKPGHLPPVDPANLRAAVDSLRKSRRANPRFAPALHVLAYALSECGQLAEALHVNDELIAIVPNSSKALVQRAEILVMLDRKLDALGALRKASLLDPHDFQATHRLGELYRATGQHERAIESFRKAIAIVYSNTGIESGSDPEVAAASKEFRRQSVAAFQVWQIWRFIGLEYMSLGRYEEANASFHEALQTYGVDDNPSIRPMLQQDIARCLTLRSGR